MLLTTLDWIALGWSLSLWAGYFLFARRWARNHSSLLMEMNGHRREWMLRMTFRDNRMSDVSGLTNLSSSPTFFASTTIIIIGGLLALLGSLTQAVEVLTKLPFIADAPYATWELKVILIIMIFVFAFFRFTWAMRLFNFTTILVGATPLHTEFEKMDASQRDMFANKLGRIVALASAAHNDGLRASYYAIATLTWLVQPALFMVATAYVIGVLYHREFKSQVLQELVGLADARRE